MEHERLTPSAFADKLQLGRAVISHILNGRNNPSLDVVTRILFKVNYINSDWLLTGNGNMYKAESGKSSVVQQAQSIPSENFQSGQNQPDLFTQNILSPAIGQPEMEYRKENTVEQVECAPEKTTNQTVIYQKAPERKISKIIIYYSDSTFETFNTDNQPL
jgi:transcriptional regulator with XRE-family HTH domain